MLRKDFLHSATLLATLPFSNSFGKSISSKENFAASQREDWVAAISKIAEPVLFNLANDKLKLNMPVEARSNQLVESRKKVTHLEAVGRLLCGISPWIVLPKDDSDEGKLRTKFFDYTIEGISNCVNPAAKDYMNFTEAQQPLVDAAFLSFALIRAPKIYNSLDSTTKKNLIASLKKTRLIKPHFNNWLLFSGMIEAFFLSVDEEYDKMRIDFAVRQHDQWYKGDGTYGDGAEFHWDYYNSYVIQPFLTTILKLISEKDKSYKELDEKNKKIADRYSVIQERLIATDGSFPAIGRSLAYRCGAFHHLAHQALNKKVPKEISLAQVREALAAVIHKTLDDKENYNQNNWLRIGLCKNQIDLAEDYISTGSLYLCAAAFLPLGLPADDEFWVSPYQDWTARKIWNGENIKADKALKL